MSNLPRPHTTAQAVEFIRQMSATKTGNEMTDIEYAAALVVGTYSLLRANVDRNRQALRDLNEDLKGYRYVRTTKITSDGFEVLTGNRTDGSDPKTFVINP